MYDSLVTTSIQDRKKDHKGAKWGYVYLCKNN